MRDGHANGLERDAPGARKGRAAGAATCCGLELPKKPLTWTFPAGASDFATANEAAKSDKPPADAQKATVDDDEDPAILAERRARSRERRNALFMKLRQLSPALFAAKKPVPPKVGIAEQIIERLALDADTEKERGSDLVGTGLMAHFNIDGVFYFMAAAALLLAALWPRAGV